MARPWVRLVLVFAGLASLAGAGFVVWSSEDHARAGEASWRIAGDAGRRVLADAAELRSAQQAYVAAGQGLDFWTAKKVEDATNFAKNAVKAATDLETAAKASNEEGVAAAARAVSGSCQVCHMAHRQRMPDGSYEIK